MNLNTCYNIVSNIRGNIGENNNTKQKNIGVLLLANTSVYLLASIIIFTTNYAITKWQQWYHDYKTREQLQLMLFVISALHMILTTGEVNLQEQFL